MTADHPYRTVSEGVDKLQAALDTEDHPATLAHWRKIHAGIDRGTLRGMTANELSDAVAKAREARDTLQATAQRWEVVAAGILTVSVTIVGAGVFTLKTGAAFILSVVAMPFLWRATKALMRAREWMQLVRCSEEFIARATALLDQREAEETQAVRVRMDASEESPPDAAGATTLPAEGTESNVQNKRGDR